MSTPRPSALLALVLTLATRPALAQDVPPTTIPYQGYLTTEAGAVDDTVDIDIALFAVADPGDTEEPLWSETHVGVLVSAGLFEISLGAVAPIAHETLALGTLFLELTVEGETLSPRLPIDSVPYARIAEHSGRTENVGGLFVGDRAVLDADGAYLGDTLTLDGLGCESEQVPVWEGESWACQSLSAEGSPLTLAGQSCEDGDLVSGIDESGLPICEDGAELVTGTFLNNEGYITAAAVTGQGVFSPTNRPGLGAFDNVPGTLADSIDNNTQFSGTAPVVISSTTISLSGNGCDTGEVLGFDGAQFECRPRPSLSCEVRSGNPIAACQGSEILVGGGFDLNDTGNGALWVQATAHSVPSGFQCGLTASPAGSSNTCYAICCTYQ